MEWIDEITVSASSLPDLDLVATAILEGRGKLITHLRRERDPQLAERKQVIVLRNTRHLDCEVCGLRQTRSIAFGALSSTQESGGPFASRQ